MRDGMSDVVDELTTLARELERVATSTDGYDTVWRGIYEIQILRQSLEIAERQLHALVRLAWLPPVRNEGGLPWDRGEWRAGYRKGYANTPEEALRDMLDAAGEDVA